MKDLIKLLANATPAQIEELGNALHVAHQISVADQRYEGAPKADFYERLRAASNLNKFVEALHAELKQHPEYKAIQLFSRQINALNMNHDFRAWMNVDYGHPFGKPSVPAARSTYMEASWVQARQNFSALVKDFNIAEITNIVEILHEEGAGLIGRNYHVEISDDKKHVLFRIEGYRELVLYDFPQ
jgi:hypothetical protein